MDLSFWQRLVVQHDSRLVLLVLDGLGGLPHPETGLTELETAHTPHLDRLAREYSCGLSMPVGFGVAPGSAPGHLALFGYDPIQYQMGRGVLSALGLGMQLRPGDIAVRLNFATFAPDGTVQDRRAGRIPTSECERLCRILTQQVRLEGVEFFLEPEMDYRAALVLRGEGLHAGVSDSDPQETGVPPRPVTPLRPEAARTAALLESFARQAREVLAGEPRANGVLMRGADSLPHLPQLPEHTGLRMGAVAAYPMYLGLARLVGMNTHRTENTVAAERAMVEAVWNDYDYLFIHIKGTDSAGEDGDFARKVQLIEQVDAELIPALLDKKPTVLVVTGDHSTPATLRAHSWHPVPTLLMAPYTRRNPDVRGFGETDCLRGSLGTFPATALLPLMLAHGRRTQKFGA